MADRKSNNQSNEMERYPLGSGAGPPPTGKNIFEIRVKGQLDSRWSDWLGGLEVRLLDNGEMILFGPVIDQAALMGILNKLGRLNLTLCSLNQVDNQQKETE